MNRNRQAGLYRQCRPVVDRRYDTDGETPLVMELADALAEAKGVDVTALPSLYDVVNVEAISQLFEHHDGNATGTALLSFSIDNWNVFIRGDGRIRVCDTTQVTQREPVFSERTG